MKQKRILYLDYEGEEDGQLVYVTRGIPGYVQRFKGDVESLKEQIITAMAMILTEIDKVVRRNATNEEDPADWWKD